MSDTGCHCRTCQCAPPQPFIILESADGLRSSKPVAAEGRKMVSAYLPAPPSLSRGEAAKVWGPTYNTREYVWRGKTDIVEGVRVEVWQEVVPLPPPKPKPLKVCTTEQHKWCHGCKRNHVETPAPRIVEDKA